MQQDCFCFESCTTCSSQLAAPKSTCNIEESGLLFDTCTTCSSQLAATKSTIFCLLVPTDDSQHSKSVGSPRRLTKLCLWAPSDDSQNSVSVDSLRRLTSLQVFGFPRTTHKTPCLRVPTNDSQNSMWVPTDDSQISMWVPSDNPIGRGTELNCKSLICLLGYYPQEVGKNHYGVLEQTCLQLSAISPLTNNTLLHFVRMTGVFYIPLW